MHHLALSFSRQEFLTLFGETKSPWIFILGDSTAQFCHKGSLAFEKGTPTFSGTQACKAS